MSTTIALLALSVGMHATWNLLARQVPASCNYLWWGLLAHLLLLGPLGIYGLSQVVWTSQLILVNILAAIALSAYFVALRHAYRFAPAAFVYPLARSSPLLIVIWTWLWWDQLPSQLASLGIGLSLIGLWLLAMTSSKQSSSAQALAWVALAAFCTSIYSLCDKLLIQHLPSFTAILGYVSLSYLLAFLLMSALNWHETKHWIPRSRPNVWLIVLGGLCIGNSYALIIQVMNQLDAATAVSFSNAGIVIVSIISIFVLKEQEQWLMRLVAASLISLGLVILGSSL
ncbi:MAG: EamA family transporter [Thiothrix sp.]|nr:MAG: EamA family transporter [Thiothrix sp.]